MQNVLVTHSVADFDTWKQAFDEHEPTRQNFGINTINVYRSSDNPNNVTILMEGNDPEKIQEFMNSEDLKEVMQKAGVTSEPEVKMLNPV